MGGDEIFAGYPRYLAAQLLRAIDPLPVAARRRVRTALEGRLTMGRPGRMRGPRRNLLKMLRGIDQPLLERHLVYRSYYRPDELEHVLSPELRAAQNGRDPYEGHRAHLDRVSGEHWLNQLLYVDMKTFLPCLNLTYTDKMGMAASTEVRVPLLDDELVELSGRIPPREKLHGTKRKYVLKRAMEGTLPREVIWRPKAGFSAPIRAWLAGPLRPMVDDLLSPDTVRRRGLIDPDAVRRMVAANDAGTEDNALRIWALLTLELWQRTFTDGGAA
jgi:asparagine synthase (glutamine-hydrolysing)